MLTIIMSLLFVAPEWVRKLTKERQPDIFWAEYVVFPIVQIVVVLVVILTLIAWLIYLERRNSKWLQANLTGWRVTPWATLRPAAASIKRLLKADGIPADSDKAIFRLSPLLSFIAAFLALALMPWGATWATIASVNIGFLFIFAFSSLSALGLTLAGWSEESPTAPTAALRSAAQVIVYYLAMGLAASGVLIFSHTLSMTGIVEAQQADHIWYIAFQPLGFLLFVVAAVVVTNHTATTITADDAEHQDYRWSLFLISEYLQMIVLAATMVTLYLGGWSFPGLSAIKNQVAQTIVSILIFAAKTLLLLYAMRWLKRRLPPHQLLEFGWRWALPAGLTNILITAILYALAMPATRGGVFEMMRETSGRLLPMGRGYAYFIIAGLLLALAFIWLAKRDWKFSNKPEMQNNKMLDS